jgi:protocatechuate 4,5-dioxygenase, alpha chain
MSSAPDNYVFHLGVSRRGYPVNRLLASLKDEGNRRRFSENEAAYCDAYELSPEQKKAILDRDWPGMLDLGASIFYAYKLAVLDNKSIQYLAGAFTGMTAEEFADVMRSGGRKFG